VFSEVYFSFLSSGRSTCFDGYRKAVIYCRDHDILKEFLEKNAREVMGMLMTEWNWDDALAVRYEEGMEKGIEKGREEIARNALVEGASIEFVQKITGLDMDTIKNLQAAL
jgi:predicted transposase YdaD